MRRTALNSSCLLIILGILTGSGPRLLFSQGRKPVPPPAKPAAKSRSWPTLPTPRQNTPAVMRSIDQQLAEKAMSHVLNDQLPLKLNADSIYPTVDRLPGGAFAPHPLTLTTAGLDLPLAPGDYTIPIFAFCTEYSVHRPGRGIAYRLGPLQGKASAAIGALLWRGMIEENKPPQQLQAISWAIQSGLRYAQMPKTYQAVIDEVIPDHKGELNGDFMQSLEDAYSGYGKAAHLPPLEQMLAKMGKAGALALSARRQRTALLRQNTTDQIREQILFAGQESRVYTPVKAEEGPWTEKVRGVAYMRFKIGNGNMAGNNIMEIRILPQGGALTDRSRTGHLVSASFGGDSPLESPLAHAPSVITAGPSVRELTQDSIGCALGEGAQCLIPVPVNQNNPSCPAGQQLIQADKKPPPPTCQNPSKGTLNDTGLKYLQVKTGVCEGSKLDAIEFSVNCGNPRETAHIVQFVSRSVCSSRDAGSCIAGQSYPAKRSSVCAEYRAFTADPNDRKWYLDSEAPVYVSGQDPYLDDGVAGSPHHEGSMTTRDQPGTGTLNADLDQQIALGNYTMTSSFTDFVVCGKRVLGTFTWERVTSGKNSKYRVHKATGRDPSQLERFQTLTTEQNFLPWPVETLAVPQAPAKTR